MEFYPYLVNYWKKKKTVTRDCVQTHRDDIGDDSTNQEDEERKEALRR